MDSAEQIIKINDKLKADKANFEPIFNNIRTYVTPNRDAIYQPASAAQQTGTRERFDSTAVHAAQLLASSIQGAFNPTTTAWYELAFREDELNDNEDVKDWLEDCTKRMHKVYQTSNFGTAHREGYIDLVGPGTSAIQQDELPRNEYGEFTGVTFQAFPVNEYTFVEGADGLVNQFFREFKLTAIQAFEKFSNMPNFNGLGEKVEQALSATDKKKQHEQFKFLHAIRPRRERRRGSMFAADMTFESRYINVDTKHDIQVGGYMEFPVSIARWDKQSADMGWGRSPAWIALPEAMSLSQINKLGLKALAKDVAPPLTVPHKGVIGGIKTSPNAINYYNASRNNGAKPEYMTSGSKWDIAQFNVERIENRIQRIFFVDQLQLQDGPQMTATEAQIRFELMQRLLGPTFWRLSDERFNPTIYRTFQIMLRAGAFKPVPAVLRSYAQRGRQPTLDVQYIGPLAKAQRMNEVVAIERTYQLAQGISAATGETSVFDNLDADEAIRLGAEQLGAPGKITRDKRITSQIRDQRNQAQQAQIEAEQLATVGQGADRLASANQKLAATA
ncbi:portal protein [Primorskyibacter sedentarius]|uniref:portal protein n=1 Tax=Primorskyibacter sedentarius TaxID=745311 RepID=UPI003EB9369C